MEEQARKRVRETPELEPHEAIIFYDWPNWDEHLGWVCKAPIDEIVDWAETTERQVR